MRENVKIILFILIFPISLGAQSYNWPLTPFTQQHWINGTFCENRPSGSILRDHFHSGVDINLPQGNPVYSVADGTVSSMGSQGTANAWIRVGYYAYVHVEPLPGLAIGDPVTAFETIIGYTNDQNHIHFIQGLPGAQENPLLDGGLTPFVDNYDPEVVYIHYYVDGTNTRFPSNRVYGKVDIVSRAMDRTDSGPISGNNGIYEIGFKVLTADRSTVLVERTPFKFDTKPSNSFVTWVYNKGSNLSTYIYRVTNGIGPPNRAWDTTLMDTGYYEVMVHTMDTQGRSDTLWSTVKVVEPDTVPPATPDLKAVRFDGVDGFIVEWYPNDEDDIVGYRLESNYNLQGWQEILDETQLTDTSTFVSYPGIIPSDPIYFRLYAVDYAAFDNLSPPSDVYGFIEDPGKKHVLLVDGFDRRDGAWSVESHEFAMEYGNIFNWFSLAFDVVANEAVEDGSVSLTDYDAVFWMLGDESVETEALSVPEQSAIASYIDAGGMLFISGSRLAYDLDPEGNPAASADDEQFLNDYIGADYAGTSSDFSGSGATGSVFDGFTFAFGSGAYQLPDYDVIEVAGSGTQALLNGSGEVIGVQTEVGSTGGKVIYSSPPFINLSMHTERLTLTSLTLEYFGVSVGTRAEGIKLPSSIILHQSMPNPANPSAVIRYELPSESTVNLTVFDVRGHVVRNLVRKVQNAGVHEVTWDGSDGDHREVASGIYIYRLATEREVKTKKLVLVR